MRFKIILPPEAVEDLCHLRANVRAEVKDAIVRHLLYKPTKISTARIKRLRGLSQPQFRLRVGDVRVFYDVEGNEVHVLAIVSKQDGEQWLKREDDKMRRVPLNEVKDELSRYLREAEKEEIIITRHGKPAAVLIGFASEDDWFEYRLENDSRFQKRVARARRNIRAGQGIALDKLQD